MRITWIKLAIFLLIFGTINCNDNDNDLNYNAEEFPDEFVHQNQNHDKVTKCKNKHTLSNLNGTVSERQNGFMEWLGLIIGIKPTTTTPKPSSPEEKDCPPCNRCGVPNNGTKIVGGTETGINQYPWMAMLLYSNRFYCGASLINDRYVLASHCVHGFNPSRITVRLLEHDRSDSSETQTMTFNVEKIIKHPRYSQTNFDNDIALVKLKKPVTFEGILNPVCLPTPGEWFTGRNGVVTGWGTLNEGGEVSQTLQHVSVPIISNSACKKTKYRPERITDNMMCAGYSEGQKDSCQGDSGGPLHVVDEMDSIHQIVGVVSWGEGCAKEDYPGVYARVNRYGAWIKQNTDDACKCTRPS